jgi:hypothetical protein
VGFINSRLFIFKLENKSTICIKHNTAKPIITWVHLFSYDWFKKRPNDEETRLYYFYLLVISKAGLGKKHEMIPPFLILHNKAFFPISIVSIKIQFKDFDSSDAIYPFK